MTAPRTPREISERFCAVVDGILGAYLEASMGMGTLAGQWIEWHSQKLDEVAESSDEEKLAAFNPSITLTGTVAGRQARRGSPAAHPRDRSRSRGRPGRPGRPGRIVTW